MFIAKAAVVGAGTMGGEIAQVIAAAGIPVVLKDVEQRFVDQGLEKAEQVTQAQLGGLVQKEKISQEEADSQASELLGRIHGTTEYEGFGDVDFVVEAVPERMDIKQAVFAELDAVTPGQAILSSNTSSLSITEMAEATSRPEQVCGFHFFYPASMMRLIEVIEGEETSDETLQARDRGGGPRRPGGRQGDQGLRHGADGPVLPHRPARARHGAARRGAPQGELRRPLLRVAEDEGARRGGEPRPEDREGVL
jgi:hypothetical protein